MAATNLNVAGSPVLAAALAAGRRAVASVGGALGAFVRAAQFARLVRVLHEMSDAQLAQIGLTRADIPTHAARIVALDR